MYVSDVPVLYLQHRRFYAKINKTSKEALSQPAISRTRRNNCGRQLVVIAQKNDMLGRMNQRA